MVSASRKSAQKVKSRDTVSRIPGIGTDASIRSPGTGKSPGIWGARILDEDRLFAATREPIGHRIVFDVANDVFDNWFTVNDPKTEGPDAELDRKIQDALKQLNAKAIFIDALTWARTYGWSLIAVQFKGATQLGREIKARAEILSLAVYDKSRVRELERDIDKDSPHFDDPLFYELNRGSSVRTRIHYSRVIRIPAGLNEMSALDPIMDDLTYLRNIRWAMGQTMYRTGSGFAVIGIKGATDDELDAYNTDPSFNPTARSWIALNPDKVTQFEFKGAQAAALNPTFYYNPIIENISAGSGIPSAILRGAQAGALTGSEVNEREYFKLISSLQSQVEPFVRQLIDMLIESGQIAFEGDYEIQWKPGFEPSELNRNQADLYEEQANRLRLDYMTVNELREKQGLKSLPDGGDVVPGLNRPASPFGGANTGANLGLASADTIFYYISKCKSPACGFVFDSLRNPEGGDVACPKCQGPCTMWLGDSPPGHLQEFDQEGPGQHPSMARLLHAIVDRAKAKTIDRSQAVAEAHKVIEDFGKIEDQRALTWIRHRMKRPDITLAPEQQMNLQNWRQRHIKDFTAILDDALKAGEPSVPAGSR